MRYNSRTRGALWLMAGAASLVVAGTMPFQSRQSMQTAVQGRFTKAQMLSLSEPRLQSLLGGANVAQAVAAPNTTFNSAGQSVHYWNIDLDDPATGDTAHLLWNGDTGELLRASRCRRLDKCGAYDAPSTKAEAVNLAWDWFHALKIDRPSEEWSIVETQKKCYAQWDFYIRCGDHYSVITIDTVSGQLVQAITGHLPDAKMAWMPLKSRLAS